MKETKTRGRLTRRSAIASAFATPGLGAFERAGATVRQGASKDAPIPAKDTLRITRLETFLVKPR